MGRNHEYFVEIGWYLNFCSEFPLNTGNLKQL